MTRFFALLLILLSSCATVGPADVRVQCLPMVEYNQQKQIAINQQLNALPDMFSAIKDIIIDYEKMRDADRACQSQKGSN